MEFFADTNTSPQPVTMKAVSSLPVKNAILEIVSGSTNLEGVNFLHVLTNTLQHKPKLAQKILEMK